LPSLNALYEEFKNQGFALLLVNLGEHPDVVRRTAQARRYTAPVLLDSDGRVSSAYLVTATPTVYLVDRRGRIVARAIGSRDWVTAGRSLIGALVKP